MAKYDITHSCGHVITHNICGPVAGRDKQADFLASRFCTECYHQEQVKQAKEATAELPALKGSEKQIDWAVRIRAEAHTRMLDHREKMAASPVDSELAPQAKVALASVDTVINEIFAETLAKAWIERRHSEWIGVLQKRAFEIFSATQK